MINTPDLLLSERLPVKESKAVLMFWNVLLAELKHGLFGIWVFGSKTRGQSTADSDLDLLVVVRELAPSIRWRIRELAADCSFDYDVLINTHILDQFGWEQHAGQKSTFWREIERDGLALLNTPQFTVA